MNIYTLIITYIRHTAYYIILYGVTTYKEELPLPRSTLPGAE